MMRRIALRVAFLSLAVVGVLASPPTADAQSNRLLLAQEARFPVGSGNIPPEPHRNGSGVSIGVGNRPGLSFKNLVESRLIPLGDIIVALLYALAFIAFLVGMVRYFLSPDDKERAKGKKFALWSIFGLVVLFAVWGIVNLLLRILTEFAA